MTADPRSPHFATTAWSRVLRAASPKDEIARPALAELCEAYWYPLYAYARRRGRSPAAAEDAVQSFFVRLIDKEILQYADPDRGRFRGFLASAFRQFLAKEHEAATAQKRSPGSLSPIDAVAGEARFAAAIADHVTAERLFEYDWALTVVEQARTTLEREQDTPEKAARFAALAGTMTGQTTVPIAELAARMGLRDGTVRVAIHRLRQRYAQILRDAIAATLDDGESVDDELQRLMAALSL